MNTKTELPKLNWIINFVSKKTTNVMTYTIYSATNLTLLLICLFMVYSATKISEYLKSEYTLNINYWQVRLYNLTYPTNKSSNSSSSPKQQHKLSPKTNTHLIPSFKKIDFPQNDSENLPKNLPYRHGFKFDGRPKEILYKFTREEIKLCTCGEFDCLEQQSIQNLFKNEQQRPTFQEYKNILNDAKLRTSAKNSLINFQNSVDHFSVIIISKNGYNNSKTKGGDHWIVRLVTRNQKDYGSRHVKQIVVPPISRVNFRNGTCVYRMPILPESYVKKLDFKLQVYLERSAEMIEVNRRAMSSYHLVGRVMRVDLPLKFENPKTKSPNTKSSNTTSSKTQSPKTQYPKTQNHHKLGQCGMFPLQKACNFSSSTDRTWYCYAENADCEPFEKSMKFTVTKTTNDMYGIADVLEECSVGLMRKTGTKAGHQVFKEENFQEIALETDYNKIVRKDPSIPMIQQSKFDHWCYGRYVTQCGQTRKKGAIEGNWVSGDKPV